MKRIIIVLVFLTQSYLFGEGTSGFAFLKLPFGTARIQGLGGNGVSLLEGIDSLRINPAGIGFAQMSELSFSLVKWIDDFNGKCLSYVKPYGTSVIGFDLAYFSTEGFEIRDQNGVTINAENVRFKDIYLSFSVAKSFFMERFSIGAAVKHLRENRYISSDNEIAYDIGAVLKLGRRFRLGVSKQNISGDNKKVVDVVRYGGTVFLSDNLLVSVDSLKYSDSKSKVGFGAEFTLPEDLLQYGRFVFRTGYNQTPDYGRNYEDSLLKKLGLDDVSGWSFGIGVYSSQVIGRSYGVEYSFTPYGELGKTSQITFKMQF